MILRSLLTLHL